MIINSSEIKYKISNEISVEKDSIIIISAFCKLDALEFIEENIKFPIREKKILIRWRAEDLIRKSSDIEIYNFCINNGWDMYINFDIHAKVYLFNRMKCIVGSSNLTNSGFNMNGKGNLEINSLSVIEETEVRNIMNLFDMSYKMNDDMFYEMKKFITAIDTDSKVVNFEWSNSILENINCEALKFFSYELFDSNNVENISKHDMYILGITCLESKEVIREALFKSKIYKWLEVNIKDEMYFGELSCLLHNDLLDDPNIYRSTVKDHLACIFMYINEFDNIRFMVDRPRYSQRIRRINE